MGNTGRIGRQLGLAVVSGFITITIFAAVDVPDPPPLNGQAHDAAVVAVSWTGNRYPTDALGVLLDTTKADSPRVRDGRIISIGLDGRVKVWAVRPDGGKLLQTTGPTADQKVVPFLSVAAQTDGAAPAASSASSGGPLIFAGGMDGKIQVFLRTDRPLRSVDQISPIQFSELKALTLPRLDATTTPFSNFAVATKTQVFLVPLDLKSAAKPASDASDATKVAPPRTKDYTLVAMDSDGSIAAGTGDPVFYWWDNSLTAPPVPVSVPDTTGDGGTKQPTTVDALALSKLSSGGPQVAISGSKVDGLARLWRRPIPSVAKVDLTGDIFAVSADGRRIVGSETGKNIKFWDVSNQNPSVSPTSTTAGTVDQIAITPDGKWIVFAANTAKSLSVWKTSKPTLETSTFPVNASPTLLAAMTDPADPEAVRVIVSQATTTASARELILVKYASSSSSFSNETLGDPAILGNATMGAFDPDGLGLVLVTSDALAVVKHYDLAQKVIDRSITLDSNVARLVAVKGQNSTKDWLAAGTNTGRVKVWAYPDLGNSPILYDVAAAGGAANAFAISSSPGRLVVADSSQDTLRLYELRRANPKGVELEVPFPAKGAKAVGALQSADGSTIAAYADGKNVILWAPKALGTYGSVSKAKIDSIALDPQGRVLARYSGGDRTVRLAVWSPDATTEDSEFPLGPSRAAVLGVPDSGSDPAPLRARIVVGTDKGTVLFSVAGQFGPPIPIDPSADQPRPVKAIGFTRNSQEAIAALDDGTVAFFNGVGNSAGETLHLEMLEPPAPSDPLFLSGLGPQTIAAISGEGILSATKWGFGFWVNRDPKAGPLPVVDSSSSQPIYSLAWRSMGGTQRLAAGAGGRIYLFDSSDGVKWESPKPPPALASPPSLDAACKIVYALTFVDPSVSGGLTLAAACDDGVVRAWDETGTTTKATTPPHGGPVYGIAFRSGSPPFLASPSADTKVGLWDPTTPTLASVFSAPIAGTDAMASVAFSPDGSRMLTLDYSKVFLVYDIPKNKTDPFAQPKTPLLTLRQNQTQPLNVVWFELPGGGGTLIAYPYDKGVAVKAP
jgi:WD40 repeat protein